MWDAWAAGDRKGALAAVPDELVDRLVLHGSPAEVVGPGAAVRRRRGAHADPAPVLAARHGPAAAARPRWEAEVRRRRQGRSCSPARPVASARRWRGGSRPRERPASCSPIWTARRRGRCRGRTRTGAIGVDCDVTDEGAGRRAGDRGRGAVRPGRPVLLQRRHHHRHRARHDRRRLAAGVGGQRRSRTSTRPGRCCRAMLARGRRLPAAHLLGGRACSPRSATRRTR